MRLNVLAFAWEMNIYVFVHTCNGRRTAQHHTETPIINTTDNKLHPIQMYVEWLTHSSQQFDDYNDDFDTHFHVYTAWCKRDDDENDGDVDDDGIVNIMSKYANSCKYFNCLNFEETSMQNHLLWQPYVETVNTTRSFRPRTKSMWPRRMAVSRVQYFTRLLRLSIFLIRIRVYGILVLVHRMV